MEELIKILNNVISLWCLRKVQTLANGKYSRSGISEIGMNNRRSSRLPFTRLMGTTIVDRNFAMLSSSPVQLELSTALILIISTHPHPHPHPRDSSNETLLDYLGR